MGKNNMDISAKKILTTQFDNQKKNFNIKYELDKKIEKFILKLNKNKDIVTFYSCEGIDENNNNHGTHCSLAYFGMNISENIWDLFWTKIIPDIILINRIVISSNSPLEGIFLYAIDTSNKEKFWNTIFMVFKKHNLI